MIRNQVFSYNETQKELDDLKSSVKNLEAYLKRQANAIFKELVTDKYTVGSIIKIRNSDFVYRIVDVDLLETDEKGLMPYVYAIRVNKNDFSKLKSQSIGVQEKLLSKHLAAFNIIETIKY